MVVVGALWILTADPREGSVAFMVRDQQEPPWTWRQDWFQGCSPQVWIRLEGLMLRLFSSPRPLPVGTVVKVKRSV